MKIEVYFKENSDPKFITVTMEINCNVVYVNFHKKHGFCTGAALLACSSLGIVVGCHLPPFPPAAPPDLLGCWQDDLLHHRLCAPPLHLRHCWHLWPPHRLGTVGLHLSCLWPQQLLRHQPVRRQNQKQAAMVMDLVKI